MAGLVGSPSWLSLLMSLMPMLILMLMLMPSLHGNVDQVAERLQGFSGADIELLCREAAMMPVRRLMGRLMALGNGPASAEAPSAALPIPQPPGGAPTAASFTSGRRGPYAGGGVRGVVAAPDVEALLRSDAVGMQDLLAALDTTRPSSDGNVLRFVAVLNRIVNVDWCYHLCTRVTMGDSGI